MVKHHNWYALDGATHVMGVDETGLEWNGGATLAKVLTGTATWDPASLVDGADASTTVTVTGAALGDIALVSFSVAVPAGAFLTGDVTAADTVTVKLLNETGGALDLASGTVRATVIQH